MLPFWGSHIIYYVQEHDYLVKALQQRPRAVLDCRGRIWLLSDVKKAPTCGAYGDLIVGFWFSV